MRIWALNKIKGLWSWYCKRPTWQKCFLWIVLIVVVLLIVVAFVGALIPAPKKPSGLKPDAAHGAMVDSLLNDLSADAGVIREDINQKKKELAEKLNQAGVIDANTIKRRDDISRAATMEELDRLQKELGL